MTFTPLYQQESDILDSPLLPQKLAFGLRIVQGQKVPNDNCFHASALRVLSPAGGRGLCICVYAHAHTHTKGEILQFLLTPLPLCTHKMCFLKGF